MMKINRKSFFDGYRKTWGSLKQSQVDGLTLLLDFIEADDKWNKIDQDVAVKQISYLLATIKHECDDTWEPIEEYAGGQAYEADSSQQYRAVR